MWEKKSCAFSLIAFRTNIIYTEVECLDLEACLCFQTSCVDTAKKIVIITTSHHMSAKMFGDGDDIAIFYKDDDQDGQRTFFLSPALV